MSSLDQSAPTPAAPPAAKLSSNRNFMPAENLPIRRIATAPPVTAADVVGFWQQAGPSMWFAKDADFDRRFRETFLERTRPRRAANSMTG